MAAVNRGFGSTIGFGFESTWGTAVSRTNWLRAISNTLKREIAKEKIPHLGSYGQASTNYRYSYLASDNVSGTVEWPVAFDDSSISLLRACLGGNTTTGVGPYTHTLSLVSPLPASLGWLTIESIYGTMASTGGNGAEVFEGCLANSLTLACSAGGVMTGSIDFIGETSGGAAAAGTPTYSSNGEYVKHNQLTSLTYNSTTRKLRDFKLMISRGLDRNQELGSLFTQQPVENRLRIEAEVSMLWQTQDWKDEFLNNTQSNCTIVWTGSTNNLMTMTLHNVLIEDVSDPVSTAGGVVRTVKMCAYADGTNQGLTIACRNDNSTVTAN